MRYEQSPSSRFYVIEVLSCRPISAGGYLLVPGDRQHGPQNVGGCGAGPWFDHHAELQKRLNRPPTTPNHGGHVVLTRCGGGRAVATYQMS